MNHRIKNIKICESVADTGFPAIPSKNKKNSTSSYPQRVDKVFQEGTISTSFGKLRVKFAGKFSPKKTNLVLFIHGSGLINSYDTYHELAFNMMEIEQNKSEWFYVMFDCPGYGKSEGKRGSIRDYSLRVIKEVIYNVGYKKAYALYGHSQGSVAIFNAVFENPSITKIIIQDGPVFSKGKLSLLNKVYHPTLLICDVDDKGHPIETSRLIFKRLKRVKFITYSSYKTNKYVGKIHHTKHIWWRENFQMIFLDFLKNPKTQKEPKEDKKFNWKD